MYEICGHLGFKRSLQSREFQYWNKNDTMATANAPKLSSPTIQLFLNINQSNKIEVI
jgi:hypothetical protein